jgi:hypothetical protein
LISSDSTTGWITGWTTGFSSSFFILLSKCMIFLVFVLHCFSTWSQSRKIIESGQDDTTNSNTLLNIILQIVTSIDPRVQRMETDISITIQIPWNSAEGKNTSCCLNHVTNMCSLYMEVNITPRIDFYLFVSELFQVMHNSNMTSRIRYANKDIFE